MRHHSAVVGFFFGLSSHSSSHYALKSFREQNSSVIICAHWRDSKWCTLNTHDIGQNISKTLSLIDNVRCQKKYRLHYDKCRWESWCCLEPQASEIEKPASSFFTHLHGKSNSNKTNSKHSVDMALNVLRWFITDSVSTVSNSWYGAIPSANVSQLHWFTMCLFWPSQLKFNFCR